MSCYYYYYLFLIFLVSIQDIREHQQQLINCNLITTNLRRFAYDYQVGEQFLKLINDDDANDSAPQQKILWKK